MDIFLEPALRELVAAIKEFCSDAVTLQSWSSENVKLNVLYSKMALMITMTCANQSPELNASLGLKK